MIGGYLARRRSAPRPRALCYCFRIHTVRFASSMSGAVRSHKGEEGGRLFGCGSAGLPEQEEAEILEKIWKGSLARTRPDTEKWQKICRRDFFPAFSPGAPQCSPAATLTAPAVAPSPPGTSPTISAYSPRGRRCVPLLHLAGASSTSLKLKLAHQ